MALQQKKQQISALFTLAGIIWLSGAASIRLCHVLVELGMTKLKSRVHCNQQYKDNQQLTQNQNSTPPDSDPINIIIINEVLIPFWMRKWLMKVDRSLECLPWKEPSVPVWTFPSVPQMWSWFLWTQITYFSLTDHNSHRTYSLFISSLSLLWHP